jgi:hypothetical protein
MKRVAKTSEPPVVVPIIVVTVDVHVALVVPLVERSEFVKNAICATIPQILSGLNIISHHNASAFYTKYFHFLKFLRILLYLKP